MVQTIRKNPRDTIDNILANHTHIPWVYESHIVDYHYWTTHADITFQKSFFKALEKEGLALVNMTHSDDRTHIYIGFL